MPGGGEGGGGHTSQQLVQGFAAGGDAHEALPGGHVRHCAGEAEGQYLGSCITYSYSGKSARVRRLGSCRGGYAGFTLLGIQRGCNILDVLKSDAREVLTQPSRG